MAAKRATGVRSHQACTEAGDIIEATHVLRWDTGRLQQCLGARPPRPSSSRTQTHASGRACTSR